MREHNLTVKPNTRLIAKRVSERPKQWWGIDMTYTAPLLSNRMATTICHPELDPGSHLLSVILNYRSEHVQELNTLA